MKLLRRVHSQAPFETTEFKKLAKCARLSRQGRRLLPLRMEGGNKVQEVLRLDLLELQDILLAEPSLKLT